MVSTHNAYSKISEVLVVALARRGVDDAFTELVRRRQSWIRNLMRRCCGDPVLADDLAQQVFLQVWQKIGHLQDADKFGAWLKRVAINVWLQHLRKNDVLRNADELDESASQQQTTPGLGMDLDRALSAMSNPERLCVILSYHEGMSHGEIAELTDLPLGTVKSHINRGAKRLKQLLSDYQEPPEVEKPNE